MRKKFKTLIPALILLSLSFANNAIAAVSSTPLIGGEYSTCGGKCRETKPLFLLFNQNSQNWEANENIKGLPTLNYFAMDNTECHGSSCIATGNYMDSNREGPKLLLLNSQDAGNHWTRISKIKNLSVGSLDNLTATLHSSCSDKMCFVMGSSSNTPYLFISNDGGANWQNITKFNGLPSTRNQFTQINCQGSDCVMLGGQFDKNQTVQPLILNSKDAGQSWNINNNIKLPADYANHLSILKCQGQQCFMIGTQQSDATHYIPLFVSSNDGGHSWQSVSQVTLPKDLVKGVITNVNCQNSVCLAVGNYQQTTDGSELPLILSSDDYGQSWKTAIDASAIPSHNLIDISGISCTSKACIIVGSYSVTDNVIPHPLVLIATKNGNSWMFNNSVSMPNIADGNLFDVKCDTRQCVAAGYYTTPQNDEAILILNSIDNGLTWNQEKAPQGVPSTHVSRMRSITNIAS